MAATARGVLYVKWGERAEAPLRRSIASVKAIHPEFPVHVHELPAASTLHDKARMFDYTPFDETLYLDVDTIVFGRLDYAFERAARFGGIACTICENPLARRHAGLADAGDLVEYNTGVLFFTRAAEPLFRCWAQIAPTLDATTRFIDHAGGGAVRHQTHDDQASFAKAVDETGIVPYVLPINWNLRPNVHRAFFGPVKIWHDYRDPPAALVEWNRKQTAPDAV